MKTDYSPIVRREATLHRMRAADARVVMAIAPAGYGKSTMMRQYAADYSNVAICDCFALNSPAEIAQNVAFVLARGDDAREALLQQERLALDDAAGWTSLALDWWNAPGTDDLFIFENVEQILGHVENVELLSRLFARTNERRRIGVCSRTPLPFSWHRFFAPHEVFLLRERDLRFERHEIGAFFERELSAAELDAVCEISRGWPIAILLLARIDRSGELHRSLRHAEGIEFRNLYDYLSDEVLAAASQEQLSRLIATAAIPNAVSTEVALATGLPDVDLADYVRGSPFVYEAGKGVFEAHPLVRTALRERFPERWREAQLRLADALVAERPLRSAELLILAGEKERAAALLGEQAEYFVTEIPRGFAELVDQIDRDIMLKYPALWAATGSVRASLMGSARWLAEALVVASHLREESALSIRFGVLLNMSNVLSNLGRHHEALETLRSIARPGETLPEPYQAVVRECARGNVSTLRRRDDYEHAKMRCYASLIAAGLVAPDIRTEVARYAFEAAEESNEPLLSAVAAVACAELDPKQRDLYTERALSEAARAQAPRFLASVQAHAAGRADCDILAPMVRRYRVEYDTTRVLDDEAMKVSMLDGRVMIGSRTARLSKRETELVMFLATRARPCSAEEILEGIWRVSGGNEASVLRVYVRRVRGKLGDEAITLTDKGYALGPSFTVDVQQIEELVAAHRNAATIDDTTRSSLEAEFDRLTSRPHAASNWDWFAPIAIRLDDLTREAATMLGRDALSRNEPQRALTYAQRIIERDPCDEPARELRIRAFLAMGDRASAQREFRSYRDILGSELAAVPSERLAQLVRDPVS